jgi:predicted metal-dependent hydrolase
MTAITVRHPSFDLDELPRDWVGGSRVATAFGDAGHVFIPLGEDFFIDAVRRHRDRVTDPELRRAVNAFIGQESVHRRVHAQLWEQLRHHGLPVDGYAGFIAAVRSLEQVVPARLQLSVTAALEHYTAAFGVAFLTEDISTAVPAEMARLLAWHGLEELEHRSVAFDVLEAVDGGYLLRVAGFAVATGLLTVVPAVGTVWFARSLRPAPADRAGGPRQRPASGLAGMTLRFARRMAVHVADYLRPGFHPDRMPVPAEAAAVAAQLSAGR